jgi:hypothetical protein
MIAGPRKRSRFIVEALKQSINQKEKEDKIVPRFY